MALNLYNSAHKATNETYRNNYDLTFRKEKKGKKDDDTKQKDDNRS